MAAGIKRIDRTNVLMADLEKSAAAGVKEAAIMLKTIARQMVSRKYVKTSKQAARDRGAKHWDAATILAERERSRRQFVARVDTGSRAARAEASFQNRLQRARMKARS